MLSVHIVRLTSLTLETNIKTLVLAMLLMCWMENMSLAITLSLLVLDT